MITIYMPKYPPHFNCPRGQVRTTNSETGIETIVSYRYNAHAKPDKRYTAWTQQAESSRASLACAIADVLGVNLQDGSAIARI